MHFPPPRPQQQTPLPPDGWYPDPYQQHIQRWWDGGRWTQFVDDTPRPSRRIPWLNQLILINGIVVFPVFLLTGITNPIAIPLALVALLWVLPAVNWLNRPEPQHVNDRITALLLGATISIAIAVVLNLPSTLIFGEYASTVIFAPIFEELGKGFALLYIFKNSKIRNAWDGAMYAIWVGVGFATVENILYYSSAENIAETIGIFLLRGVFTPFVHPLFIIPIGVAIGISVSKRQPLKHNLIYGYLLAVTLHSFWNFSVTLNPEINTNLLFQSFSVFMFVLLFFTVAILLVRKRKAKRDTLIENMPYIAQKYYITPQEYMTFSNWNHIPEARKKLPRHQRWQFDEIHIALARLAEGFQQPGGIDPFRERQLLRMLSAARRGIQIPGLYSATPW